MFSSAYLSADNVRLWQVRQSLAVARDRALLRLWVQRRQDSQVCFALVFCQQGPAYTDCRMDALVNCMYSNFRPILPLLTLAHSLFHLTRSVFQLTRSEAHLALKNRKRALAAPQDTVRPSSNSGLLPGTFTHRQTLLGPYLRARARGFASLYHTKNTQKHNVTLINTNNSPRSLTSVAGLLLGTLTA